VKRKRFSVERITGILKQADLLHRSGSCVGCMGYQSNAATGGRRCTAVWTSLNPASSSNFARRTLSSNDWWRTCHWTKRCFRTFFKKLLKPVKTHEIVDYLISRYGVGNRQACRCVRLHRSMYYYRSRMDPLTAMRQRVRELAHARVRFGYRRIYMLLRCEGWDVGTERIVREGIMSSRDGHLPSPKDGSSTLRLPLWRPIYISMTGPWYETKVKLGPVSSVPAADALIHIARQAINLGVNG
jgi:hypothetical protein